MTQEDIDTLLQANPEYDFEETAESLYAIALRNIQAVPRVAPPALKGILGEDH